MRLYGSSLSPYVRKVLAYCAEKGIEVELKSVGLRSTDPDFRAASPFGKMPALVDDDFALADSSAILHYLEAKHPEPPLIPADPKGRGKAIWYEEFADTLLVGCGAKMFFNRIVAPLFLKKDGDLAAADRAECEELPPLLDYLERELGNKTFLLGEQLTIADLAVASVLMNLSHLGVEIDPQQRPSLRRYQDLMFKRPSFASLLERERTILASSR